ncbi:hypothetical protein [Paracoccus fontiphilus]|uniref:Uncharacterized protein n=1 Tax=Paracoccus fontiphilus TaxID=1815556 RepID=A0ABV7IER4_9RHOB|nr:hypothetical protein [Paracoccus fontiphilus]
MTNREPKPGPRRLGRAGIAAVAIIVAIVLVMFLGRNLWHATEVHDDPPETEQGRP